jgi:DNA-directed RNA polymerase subunit N (RpoN/RPB10)
MRRIVASIAALDQHIEAVHETPGLYRPSCCPHCGIKVVWQHGFYYRKADRRTQSKESLNPVPIRRYCCSVCRHTCSRLPLCIAPRRWYDWTVQQSVLIQLLNGFSRRECARGAAPSRHTGRILCTAMRLAVPRALNHLPDDLLQLAVEELR